MENEDHNNTPTPPLYIDNRCNTDESTWILYDTEVLHGTTHTVKEMILLLCFFLSLQLSEFWQKKKGNFPPFFLSKKKAQQQKHASVTTLFVSKMINRSHLNNIVKSSVVCWERSSSIDTFLNYVTKNTFISRVTRHIINHNLLNHSMLTNLTMFFIDNIMGVIYISNIFPAVNACTMTLAANGSPLHKNPHSFLDTALSYHPSSPATSNNSSIASRISISKTKI